MEQDGFIKLHRRIVDWEWYNDLPTFCLFIHLLLKANYVDHNWRGQVIKRGSFVTSYASLSAETALTVEQVRRALKNLQKTGEIEKVSTNKNTLIIVTKYNDYQCFATDNNKQTTNKEQTKNKQTTTTKEIKNIKNINNLYCSSDEEQEIIKTIIQMLNVETDKEFSPDTKLTRKLIQDKLNAGYSLADFKCVIEKKCDAWISDPIMKSYLKPSILFGDKFDEYLNE